MALTPENAPCWQKPGVPERYAAIDHCSSHFSLYVSSRSKLKLTVVAGCLLHSRSDCTANHSCPHARQVVAEVFRRVRPHGVSVCLSVCLYVCLCACLFVSACLILAT